MHAHEGTAISATLQSPKVWAELYDYVYSFTITNILGKLYPSNQ